MTSVRLIMLVLAILACIVSPAGAQQDSPDSLAVPESELSTEERALLRLDEIGRIRSTVEKMIAEGRGLSGEELQLKRVALLEVVVDLEEVSEELSKLIGELDESVADSARVIAGPALRYAPELFLRALDSHTGRLAKSRSMRGRVDASERAALELEITDRHQMIDDTVQRAVRSLEHLDAIGLQVDDLWEELELFLASRAESLGARLRVTHEEVRRLRDRARTGDETEDSAADLQFTLVERRVDHLVRSLKLTADIMSARGLQTADYDQLVIETTGSVTEDILNPEVLKGLISNSWSGALSWIRLNGPTLLVWFGLIVLSILLTRLAALLVWFVIRLVLRPAMLLQNLVNGLLRPMSSILGLFIGLWALGVDPGALLAGIGVLSIVVGLALQDSLGNIAAGVFILVYRPYDVDEVVQAGGVVGRVKEMGLANTTIITFDRRRLFVPNKKIWGEVIENRSAEPLRRIEAAVRIRYDEDIDPTLEFLRETILGHELVLSEPQPEVFVSRLEDSWVEISVWPWVRADNWWAMKTNLSRVLRNALDERGVVHAFPRVEIDQPGAIPPPREER